MSSETSTDSATRDRVTLIFEKADQGDPLASSELLPIVYKELRRMAQRRMRWEAPGHTLQATALVHEAYIRLLGGDGVEVTWQNRRHFIGAAAEAMRRILIEHARGRSRLKRGGDYQRETVDDLGSILSPSSTTDPEELFALDEAISCLEEVDEEAALVAKLRHLVGYTVPEVAEALGISERSVVRKWSLARAWLLRELSPP